MFCSPPGRASAQLGPGRVKILRLAFQVTTASQQKKTPLFVFTSAPPATGQLLSRLITQPRAWLGIISQMNQCFGMQKTSGYLLGSYRSATAPEPNSRRLTSFKSTYFDSPANNVGPWPASLGCTTNS